MDLVKLESQLAQAPTMEVDTMGSLVDQLKEVVAAATDEGPALQPQQFLSHLTSLLGTVQAQGADIAIGSDAAADHWLEKGRRRHLTKSKPARSAPYPAAMLFKSSASDPGSPSRS